MTIQELKATVDKATEEERDALIFVVGKRKNPGAKVRLLPAGEGPLGELMNVNAEGDCVVRFTTKGLRKWLRKLES